MVLGEGMGGFGFHQTAHMRDIGRLDWQFRLVRQKGGVALRLGGMIAVHGADWALAHETRDDKSAFADEEDEFAEMVVGKEGSEFL